MFDIPESTNLRSYGDMATAKSYRVSSDKLEELGIKVGTPGYTVRG